jgi:DNA-binding NtrC family response regulator
VIVTDGWRVHGINHKANMTVAERAPLNTKEIQSGRRPPATRGVASGKRKPGKPRKSAVLIVDDDYTTREMASVVLRHCAQVRTYRAATNTEALRKARHYEISAVISDLVRPGGGGFEFLKQFRKEHARIPVIICSGNSQPSNRRRAKQLGAFAFFPKPYRGEDLVAAVQTALASSGKARPSQRAKLRTNHGRACR